jgi:hypothetical protein
MADSSALLLSIGHWVVRIVGGLAMLATVLPILRQTAWWIRACDFPRLQIVAGLGLSLAAALVLPDMSEPPGFGRDVFMVSLAVALVYQASRIWPYTRLHRRQVADARRSADDNDHHLSLMWPTC